MKRKGFTLIELVVVIALIAILAVTLAPRLRDQIAKAGDAKAIAVLGSLRTQSEIYFADNQKTVVAAFPAATGDYSNAIKELKKGLDNSAQNLMDEVGTDSAKVPIGGSRVTSTDGVTYGGNASYTFVESGTTSDDGISIWFGTVKNAKDTTVANDTKNNVWAEY